MINFAFARKLLLCSVVLIGACGGGGGGSSHTSTPPVTPPPTTPSFAVQSIIPASGAQAVARSSQIVVEFNQNLDVASAGASVGLIGGDGSTIPLTINVTDNRIAAAPTRLLPGASVYTLTLAPNLQNSVGDKLGGNYVYSFTTASPIWQGQQASPGWSGNQIIVKGNAATGKIAIWLQYTGNHVGVFASRNDNGVWSNPLEIDDPNSVDSADQVALAVDVHGNAMAVWQQRVNTAFEIYASYFSQGSWSVPVNIASTLPWAGNASSPVVTVNPSGVFTIAWVQALNTAQAILARRFNGNWVSYDRIDNPSLSFAWSPAIAATSAGDVIVVWRQSDGMRTGIYANRLIGSFIWSSPVQIDDSTAGNADTPVISADGVGGVMAAWKQVDPTQTRNVIYANRFDSATWGSAVRIDNSSASVPPDTPVLASSGVGEVTAAWSQNNGVRNEIHATRFAKGSWSTPVQLDDPSLFNAQPPVLAVDPVGNVTVAWSQFSATHQGVYSNRWQLGAWQTPVEISSSDPSNGPANLVIVGDLTGNAEAIWTNNGISVSNVLE